MSIVPRETLLIKQVGGQFLSVFFGGLGLTLDIVACVRKQSEGPLITAQLQELTGIANGKNRNVVGDPAALAE